MATPRSLTQAASQLEKATSVSSLLAWWPRKLMEASGGRYGGYRLSPRAAARAIRRASEYGALEGATSTVGEHTPEGHVPSGSSLVAQSSDGFGHGVSVLVTKQITSLREKVRHQRFRPSVTNVVEVLVLIGVAIFIDIFLNRTVFDIVIAGAEWMSVAMGFFLSVLLVAIGEKLVRGTPEGQQRILKRRWGNGIKVALGLFAIGNVLLRLPVLFDLGVQTGVDGELGYDWVALLNALAEALVFVSLVLLPLATAALSSLSRQIDDAEAINAGDRAPRLHALRDRADGLVTQMSYLLPEVSGLFSRMVSAHFTSYVAAAGAEAALIVQPAESTPIPVESLVAQLRTQVRVMHHPDDVDAADRLAAADVPVGPPDSPGPEPTADAGPEGPPDSRQDGPSKGSSSEPGPAPAPDAHGDTEPVRGDSARNPGPNGDSPSAYYESTRYNKENLS